MNRGFGGKTAPVNVGDELDVTIEAVGKKGDGMAKKEGFVLFVPSTSKGEQVRIKVTKVLQSAGFAEVIERKGAGAGASSQQEEESEEEEEESYASEDDSEDFGEEEEGEEELKEE